MSCIVCGGRIVQTCKCLRGDRKCENGHEYHWSPHYQEYHEGQSDHAMPDEMCCLRYKLKLPVHIIYVDVRGDDWEDEERYIVRGYGKELEHFTSGQFEKERSSVSGVGYVGVVINENVSDEDLRDILTVNEYFELMETKTILKGMK